MPTIALVTDSRHDQVARGLRERLIDAWPKAMGEPSILVRHSGDVLPLAPTLDLCIVLHACDVADVVLVNLARELRQMQVPLMLWGGDGRDTRVASHDCRWISTGTDERTLAGMIAGLAARTPDVRQLDESLKYAQSVHESVARLVEQFQDDQLLAASIQRQFISQEMPQLPGVACAAMFRPIDFLSGDIYRVTRLDETHLGFFLGDAMGHGLPAALMALYIAGRVTQKEVKGDTYRILEPSESMSRLNQDLASTGCANIRFATAVCGTLDIRTRQIKLAAAGHPPPVILGPDGKALRRIGAGGPLLGVMDDSQYDQAVFSLASSEALILFSDGLEDSLNPRHPGGEQEDAPRERHIEFLEQVAAAVGEPDPEQMFTRFTQMMDSETGSMHQVDDVTLVGVRMAA